MKKSLPILIVFCIISMLYDASAVTFSWKQMPDENWRQYEYITVYRNGEEISKNLIYPDDKNSLSVNLTEGEYAFATTMGHRGTFNTTTTQFIDLPIHRLSLKFLMPDNTPLTHQSVAIIEDGITIATDYIQTDGTVHYYLRPGSKYAYRLNGYSGTIPELINGDVDKTILCNSLSVVAKYGHYPVADTFTALPESRYNYTATEISQRSTTESGRVTFTTLTDENYYLINSLGIKAGPFKASVNSHTLEYRKVTFVSNCNGNPTVLKEISVTAKGGSNSISESTDGKGHADFYLLPGNYTWHHASGSGDFSVHESDINIDITPTHRIIRFTNNGAAVVGLPVQIPAIKPNSQSATTTYVTNQNGEISAEITGEQITLSVNGIGEHTIYDITPENITVPIHKLSTTTSSYHNQQLTILDSNSNSARFLYDSAIFLLNGAYTLRPDAHNYQLSSTISIDKDMTLDMTMHSLSVLVSDTSGKVIPGVRIYVMENGTFSLTEISDASGKAEFKLLKGNYIVCDAAQAMFKEPVALTASKTVNVIIPEETTLTVNDCGVPYTGNAIWTPIGSMPTSLQIINGSVTARIDTSKPGVLALSGSNTPSIPITITSDATIDFVNASIDCTGKGIVIPELPNRHSYKIIKGTSLTLKAIPTQYGSFSKWTINGKDFTDDVIEYLVPANGIEAMATFSATSAIPNAPYADGTIIQWNVSPSPAKNTLHFPEEIDAHVSVYNMSGSMVKSVRVISNSMNVADIAPGHYILIAESTDSNTPIRKARFIKE